MWRNIPCGKRFVNNRIEVAVVFDAVLASVQPNRGHTSRGYE